MKGEFHQAIRSEHADDDVGSYQPRTRQMISLNPTVYPRDATRLRMLPWILLASLGIAGATPARPQGASARAVFPMHDAAWRCGPAGWPGGSHFAVVSGDPMGAGPFTIRVELPSGYRLPSYRRPRDESIVVLGGSIEVDTRTLRSGSFIRLRADEWHSLGTTSGAIVQIFGDGPFEMTYSRMSADAVSKLQVEL